MGRADGVSGLVGPGDRLAHPRRRPVPAGPAARRGDPEALGEPVGFFGAAGPSPYWQICAREYVERWVHHQQILRALGRPDLGPDLLAPAAEVIVASLAVHLPDLGARPGSTLTLAIPEVRRWTLHRTEDRWARKPDARDSGAVGSAATVTLDPGRAPAVLSRALTAAEALAAITATGEEPLASKAAQALATLVARP